MHRQARDQVAARPSAIERLGPARQPGKPLVNGPRPQLQGKVNPGLQPRTAGGNIRWVVGNLWKQRKNLLFFFIRNTFNNFSFGGYSSVSSLLQTSSQHGATTAAAAPTTNPATAPTAQEIYPRGNWRGEETAASSPAFRHLEDRGLDQREDQLEASFWRGRRRWVGSGQARPQRCYE